MLEVPSLMTIVLRETTAGVVAMLDVDVDASPPVVVAVAVDDDDATVGGTVLLTSGTPPFGSGRRDMIQPNEIAHSERMPFRCKRWNAMREAAGSQNVGSILIQPCTP